jgi:diamine N-acetyltransferase
MKTTKEKVIIRAMEPEDLELLYQIENDESLWGVSTTNVPYSRYALHDYMAHASGDIYTDRQVRLMIENETAQVVGIVDVVSFDPQNLRAELGIVVRKDWRQQGYGYAALSHICQYALRVLHLHQLYCYVAADNTVSLRLFEKCGFSRSVVLNEWLFDGHTYHDAILMQKIL